MTKLFTLILCLWATSAGAFPGGFLAMSTGGATTCTSTSIISQTQRNGTSDLAGTYKTIGQSFTQPTGKTSIHSIKFYVDSASGSTINMRLGDSADLSSTYLTSKSQTSVAGENEFVIDYSGLTAGNTYYILFTGTGVISRYTSASVYAGGIYRYGEFANFNANQSLPAHELYFEVTECQ